MDEQETGTERSQEDQEIEPSAPTGSIEGSKPAGKEKARDSQEGQAGDALAWLEGPAFNAPIEEMPTLQWPDVNAEAGALEEEQELPLPTDAPATDSDEPPDDLEDAIQWLEELAEKQGTPITEMPTLVSGGDREQNLPAAAAPAGEDKGDATSTPALDSDPMAWLEQLAMDQDSPLEELPSVANRLLASEIVSQYDVDADGELAEAAHLSQVIELDEALIYLEEQAKAQGLSLDDVSFEEVDAVESLDDDLDALDHIATVGIAVDGVMHEKDAALEEDQPGEEQLPDAPDALAAEDAITAIEGAVGEDLPAAGKVIAAKAMLDAAVEEELPDDEGLPDAPAAPAAADVITEVEGADGAELPEAAKVIAAKAVLDAAVEATPHPGEKEQDDWDDLSAQIPDDPDAALAWLGELAEADESQEEKGGGTALAKGAAAVAARKLLQSELEEANEGDTAPDPALNRVILEDMPDDPDEAMAWMEGLAGQAEEEEQGQAASAASADAEELPVVPLADIGPSDGPDFGLARAALMAGSTGKAAAMYRKMLDEGHGGTALVNELETAVAEQPEALELTQLLGDAYMQNGQMQKAMKAYGKGFAHL